MLLSQRSSRLCNHRREMAGCPMCQRSLRRDSLGGQGMPGPDLGLSLNGENVSKVSLRETGWARTSIVPHYGNWTFQDERGGVRKAGPEGRVPAAFRANYRAPSHHENDADQRSKSTPGGGVQYAAAAPPGGGVFGAHGFQDGPAGGGYAVHSDVDQNQGSAPQPTLRSSWAGAPLHRRGGGGGSAGHQSHGGVGVKGAIQVHAWSGGERGGRALETEGNMRYFPKTSRPSTGMPRGGVQSSIGRTAGGGSSYKGFVRDLLIAKGRPVDVMQQEERETGEGGEGYVRDEGEATVWAVRGRGAGGGKRSEQFEVLSPGNQFRRGLRSNLLQQQQLHPANVHYEHQYHEAYIQMQQQAHQLLQERKQLLSGVLHGQRVSSTAASETAWPLPSSGDPNRPVTSHATGKAGEGQWQAFAGERLEAAAAAAAARRAAEGRGYNDHKSRSEATGVVGDDDNSNNSSNASEGGQSGSTSAGPSVQPAAAAAPQPARQVVSSPSKAAGGDKTGGWSSVRESMGRARAAFAKEEPPSPSQEAEKRRKLRAAKLAEDPLPRTNQIAAFGEYQQATDEQWARARKQQINEHYRGTEEEEQELKQTVGQVRRRRGLTVEEGTKVFTVVGGNKNVRRSLTQRGMVEAVDEDADHNLFDIRWTLTHNDINFEELSPFQMANHFPLSAREVGSKVGLHRNLRSLKWFDNVDMDSFFPRMYNLANPWEMQDFVEDFIFTAAHSELTRYENGEPVTSAAPRDSKEESRKVLHAAVRIVTAFLDNRALVGDVAGGIMKEGGKPEGVLTLEDYFVLRPDKRPKDSGGGVQSPRGRKEAIGGANAGSVGGGGGSGGFRSPEKGTKKVTPVSDDAWGGLEEEEVAKHVEACRDRVRKEHHLQIDSDGTRNVWIVKPGHGSRGRGIECFDDLQKIINKSTSRKRGAIVQKYVENCLLLEGKKFDIRLWVLVTNWNPLTVWVYEPYVRICTDLHSLESSSLSNAFKHLCNRCIQEGNDGYDSDDGEGGSMWSVESLVEYLDATSGGKGEEIWSGIRSKMLQISQYTMHCVQESMDNQKGCFEWFGLDFMVDESYNTWLLECNISPDLSIGTEVLDRLVPAAMGELWDMLAMGPQVRESLTRDAEHCWDLVFRGKEIKKEVLQKRMWRKKALQSQLREGRPFGMRVALQDKLGALTNSYISSSEQKQRKMREQKAVRNRASSQRGGKKKASDNKSESSEDSSSDEGDE